MMIVRVRIMYIQYTFTSFPPPIHHCYSILPHRHIPLSHFKRFHLFKTKLALLDFYQDIYISSLNQFHRIQLTASHFNFPKKKKRLRSYDKQIRLNK